MAGIDASPTNEILVEESVIGWKEYELEVMRDTADNVVIICSIENFDPMGVHTGDSITVAPAQTLTDKEYQILRDASLKIIREIGVDTGGSNIQFGINPRNGRLVVIEMNPRVSRSSALASKATGFPIAKIAAKLAVGYTLDEIRNDITRETPACFEPTIDYVVTKIPRFTFEKFPAADATLTTQMKSVGEVMAIGRTFKESFQKALRSLEIGSCGLESRLVRPVQRNPPRAYRKGAAAPPGKAAHPELGTALVRGRRPPKRHVGGRSVQPHGDRSLVPPQSPADHRDGGGAEAGRGMVDDCRGCRSPRRARDRNPDSPGSQAVRLFRQVPRQALGENRRRRSGSCAFLSASGRYSSGSTPAPPSSSPTPPISTPRTRMSAKRK